MEKGNGNDNQLRLNACMLAPAPPKTLPPKVGKDYGYKYRLESVLPDDHFSGQFPGLFREASK